ncbi:hypothetical protein [Nonomuraea jabiensis]|uniref:hypothetical protein n=1 Tax=Nonomuraea jabiensis TaxID=882448 RepID=UPI003D745F28
MPTTKRRRRRPRSTWTEADKALWRDRKQSDKATANASVHGAAQVLALKPHLIEAFQEFAARVQGHRTLRNALAMFGQRPSALRVQSAFFWAKEDRAVLPSAEPICVIARRRGGKKVEEVDNPDTGETDEVNAGEWSGFTSERVFDVRDTVLKNRPCDHCGTHVGLRCPDSCPVYEPVRGPAPTREDVVELLNQVLKDDGGFDPEGLDGDEDGSESDE